MGCMRSINHKHVVCYTEGAMFFLKSCIKYIYIEKHSLYRYIGDRDQHNKIVITCSFYCQLTPLKVCEPLYGLSLFSLNSYV